MLNDELEGAYFKKEQHVQRQECENDHSVYIQEEYLCRIIICILLVVIVSLQLL